MGETPPSPALSYNVTAVSCLQDKWHLLREGEAALRMLRGARQRDQHRDPRPSLCPSGEEQGHSLRQKTFSNHLHKQPRKEALGRSLRSARRSQRWPWGQLHVPASCRHLTPLFHTSKDHPHLPSSSRWCVSRLAALACDRLQPRGECRCHAKQHVLPCPCSFRVLPAALEESRPNLPDLFLPLQHLPKYKKRCAELIHPRA